MLSIKNLSINEVAKADVHRINRFSSCSSSKNSNRACQEAVKILQQIPNLKTYILKKLFSLMAIVTIISVSNCTKIPENNDPIIGIWSRVDITENSETGRQTNRQEWIFNDVFLGRYHSYNGNQLEVKTDFSWTQDKGVYTISYPGTDMPSQQVSMKNSDQGTILEDVQGNVLAQRE